MMSSEVQSILESSPTPSCIRPAQIHGLKRKIKRCPNPAVLQQVDSNILVKKVSIINRKETVFNPFRKITSSLPAETLNAEPTNSELSFSQDSKSSFLERSILATFDESTNLAHSGPIKETIAHTDNVYCYLPVDWSLKTKIRFASPKPFPWRGFLKTSEEASGTTGFARCIHKTDHQECSVDTSSNARFHQQCLTWMHPYLPWLNLFPRMDHDEVGKKTGPSLFLSNTELQEKLHDEWVASFRSLYQLLKARQCPYFYLCGPAFTVLFRAGGISGYTEAQALVTPTSSGFRQALKAENIIYSMPLVLDQKNISEELQSDDDNDLMDKDEDKLDSVKEKDEEPELFLESLGLSQNDIPTFNPKRRKTEESMKKLSSAQTLVFVEGDNVHGLFNFLLTSRLCVASTGPMAGVPPTLVSPCAFSGATLTGLKVKQGWVKHRKKDMHCVELSGAIMPNNIQGLCSLFKSTQEGNFTCMLATYKPTLGFSNVPSPSDSFIPSVFATENLKDCGIDKELLEKSCKPIAQSTAYSEINVENSMFNCKYTQL